MLYNDAAAHFGTISKSSMSTMAASNLKSQGPPLMNLGSAKKAKDSKLAAANLEEASDLQR